MKRLSTLFIALVAMASNLSAHQWTVTRSWCLGSLHPRYQADADLSVLSYQTFAGGYNLLGQWVGTAPIGTWSKLCSSEDKGCTRPRTAWCQKSGTAYDEIYNGGWFQSLPFTYSSTHGISLTTSGSWPTSTDYNGRTSGGLSGSFVLDSARLSLLSDDGFSRSNFTGSAEVTDSGQLSLMGLDGFIGISARGDFFSSLKILVIVESEFETESEVKRKDSLAAEGYFLRVVDSSELFIAKGKAYGNGLFSSGLSSGIRYARSGDSLGYFMSGFSASKLLRVALRPGEHLSVVTIVDGGFDVSSAIDRTLVAGRQPTQNPTVTQYANIQVLPNPASSTITVQFSSVEENLPVSCALVNAVGSQVRMLQCSSTLKGVNYIRNIDVSTLPKGVYHLLLQVGATTTVHKVVVN